MPRKKLTLKTTPFIQKQIPVKAKSEWDRQTETEELLFNGNVVKLHGLKKFKHKYNTCLITPKFNRDEGREIRVRVGWDSTKY
jgi:hypothetical protein